MLESNKKIGLVIMVVTIVLLVVALAATAIMYWRYASDMQQKVDSAEAKAVNYSRKMVELELNRKYILKDVEKWKGQALSLEKGCMEEWGFLSDDTQEKAYTGVKAKLGELATTIQIYYDVNSIAYAGFYDDSAASFDGFEECIESPSAVTCRDENLGKSVATTIQDLARITKNEDTLSVNVSDREYCMSNKLEDSSDYFCMDALGEFMTTEVQDPCGGGALACPK